MTESAAPGTSPQLARRSLLRVPLTAAALGAGAGVVGLQTPTADAAARTVPLPEPGTCPTDPHAAKRDFRALWIASVVNIDWPSATGLDAGTQRQELLDWFDLAVAQNHTAVVLQVRPTADAFWPSRHEPWSKYLSGTQGVDPGWDPLAFAVTEAHRRNLALHAWFNPYRVSMDTDLTALVADHPARKHPDWVLAYGGKLYYNPGIPAVQRFVIDAIMDAIDRYDLDGVHFDDYFYPYPVVGEIFDDAATFARYGAGWSDLADWRRHNINALVHGVHRRIQQRKPWVQFGISPFAVWRNQATDPEGSATEAGVQTYDDLYADTRRWVRDGWIDYVVPQVYWSRTFDVANYDVIVAWWAAEIDVARTRGHHPGLFIGQATYKVALNFDQAWNDPTELSSHLELNSGLPEVNGNLYFSAKDVRADRLGASSLLTETWYAHPALTPVIGDAAYRGRQRGGHGRHAAARQPRPVRGLSARSGRLTWTADRDAVSFAVYRVDGGRPTSCDLADATHLVATRRADRGRQQWTDPEPGTEASYLVTAVDRFGRESDAVVAR